MHYNFISVKNAHAIRVELTETLRDRIREQTRLTAAAETERETALDRATKAEGDLVANQARLVAANKACEEAFKRRDELIRALQESQNVSQQRAGQLYDLIGLVNQANSTLRESTGDWRTETKAWSRFFLREAEVVQLNEDLWRDMKYN